MSLEFPEKTRKVGIFRPFAFILDGNVEYKIEDYKLSIPQIHELNKRLNKYLHQSGYKKFDSSMHGEEPPVFFIPTIGKAFVIMIGGEYVSIYPQDRPYGLVTDYECSEFKKFLGKVDEVFANYKPKLKE